MRVEPRTFRVQCSNGMVIEELTTRQIHLGNGNDGFDEEVYLSIRGSIHEFFSRFGEIVLALRESTITKQKNVSSMEDSKINDEVEVGKSAKSADKEVDMDPIRPDLSEVVDRHSFGLDEQRPETVARRQQKNQRTARADVKDLCDDRFMEYGTLAIAAQRQRQSMDDLISKTPADGLIAGIGLVNGSLFGEKKARCMVMAYDYTVLAGTQGYFSHKKMDRMLKLAHEQRLPLVLFAEGGGGRPGDVDAAGVMVAGLDLSTFAKFAGLSGRVPVLGIVSGPCFAGNAALLGCCDVIIATQNSNIGMGGPVMIEGGGLGVFRPE